MRVFLVYDQLLKNSIPIQNASENLKRSYFYQQMIVRKIKVIPVLTRYVRSTNPDDLYIYPLEPIECQLATFVSKVPLKTLKILRKAKIPILVVYPTEGYSIKAYDHWLDHLQYYFVNQGFHNIPKYFLSGNLKIDSVFERHNHDIKNDLIDVRYKKIFDIDDSQKFSKVYGVNYFEYQTVIDIQNKQREKVAPVINFEEAKKSNRTVNFLSYNRHPRSHRIALIAELSRREMISNSYYSLVGSKYFQSGPYCLNDARRYFLKKEQQYVVNFFQNWKGINIQFENSSVDDIFLSDKRHYLDTFFSLVSETEVASDTLFITEKTFKPIANYHPFIIWGNPGTLQFLRSKGYQTFPELFCEDYDNELDEVKRFHMIVDQVQNFVNLDLGTKRKKFNSILEKLKHNYQNFYSRSDEYRIDMKKIFLSIYHDSKNY